MHEENFHLRFRCKKREMTGVKWVQHRGGHAREVKRGNCLKLSQAACSEANKGKLDNKIKLEKQKLTWRFKINLDCTGCK